jgi:hypothetical protein
LNRIKLVLLITEEKLTCFAAAKKLAIPYTNAKVIYRIFRSEGRITAKSKFFRGRDQNYRFEQDIRGDASPSESFSRSLSCQAGLNSEAPDFGEEDLSASIELESPKGKE